MWVIPCSGFTCFCWHLSAANLKKKQTNKQYSATIVSLLAYLPLYFQISYKSSDFQYIEGYLVSVAVYCCSNICSVPQAVDILVWHIMAKYVYRSELPVPPLQSYSISAVKGSEVSGWLVDLIAPVIHRSDPVGRRTLCSRLQTPGYINISRLKSLNSSQQTFSRMAFEG